MKYFEIKACTPYCGEDNYYYIRTDDSKELHKYIDECIEHIYPTEFEKRGKK